MPTDDDKATLLQLRGAILLAIISAKQKRPWLPDAVIAVAVMLALEDVGGNTRDLMEQLLADPETKADWEVIRRFKESQRPAGRTQ